VDAGKKQSFTESLVSIRKTYISTQLVAALPHLRDSPDQVSFGPLPAVVNEPANWSRSTGANAVEMNRWVIDQLVESHLGSLNNPKQ
jgi:hypothetical protein